MSNLVGQQFGNYRLMRLLGQGGFADTYLGEQIYVHTYAAIKVVQTPLAQDGHEGFFNEARMIAGLKHPNIVHLIDFGVESSRHIPYLVMDFAPNGTLRQRHRRGERLPVFLVVSYSMQVASALQYAHDRQIIHRDVKPENMLVGANQEILLSDFGIAVVQSSRTQPLTSVAGTMNYMAPEQIQGRPMPASDQYALAVVIYEWLCGESPFLGSPTEIAVQQQYMTPIPLRQRVAAIPAAVEQVVLTALAKDPQARFESMRAFATMLEQASKAGPASFPFPSASPTDSQLSIPTELVSGPHLPQPPSAYQASPSVPTGPTIQAAYGPQAPSAPVPTPSGGQGPSTPLPPVSESSLPRLTPQFTPQLTPVSGNFPAPQHFSQGASASQAPPWGQQPFPPAPIQRMPSGPPQPRRLSTGMLVLLIAAIVLLIAGSGGIYYAAVFRPNQLQAQATATAVAQVGRTAQALATTQAQINATATATAALNTYTYSGTLAFIDPLSDNSKGHHWDENTNCSFIGGTYHAIAPDVRFSDYCIAQFTDFSNLVFEVQMQILKGDFGGIYFRVTNIQPDQFYYFNIRQEDGSYNLVMVNGNNSTTLASGTSPAIKQGLNQTNLLAVVVQGNNIMVYVNHQQLAQVQDSTYTRGQLGVEAGVSSVNPHPTEVAYSNARVWKL